jgi:hypothetical protein
MKKEMLSYLICSCFALSVAVAQVPNLAANGNFEAFGAHPTGPGQLALATKWTNCNGQVAFPFGTPDLFTNSGTGGTQWPNTFAGTVVPQSGDALAGFITSNFFVPDFREYCTYQLESPIVPGETYTVSFWLTNGSANWYGARGSNNIGLAFTSAPPVQIQHEPMLSITPQLELTTIIHHTFWQRYSFTFSAAQPFEFITIGNFRNDANTSIGTFTSGSGVAYYFLDNVEVVQVAPLAAEVLDLHQVLDLPKMELAWSMPEAAIGDQFVLERSLDQNHFVLVEDFGKIGKSNDDVHFVDEDALPGLQYFYRLREVTDNGTVMYSNTVEAKFGAITDYAVGNVFPNPAREMFFLDFTALTDGELNMQLVDGTGRSVDFQVQSLTTGQPSAAFELPIGLASGIYHAKFEFQGQSFSRKVVIATPN